MVIETEILIRVALAVLAGGLVGVERRIANKPAGIRTLMLVSMGAALFVLITMRTIPGEAGRIISGVATGIGFLGAGTIFRAENHVIGLTTAASIWAVSAVGLAFGLGEYILGMATTVLIVLILEMDRIEFFREL